MSTFFVPAGRYASRAEMAPTIARKIVDSKILKHMIQYFGEKDSVNTKNEALFKEMILMLSEICRES